MSNVAIISQPALVDKRRAFVLAEDRVGHYPEFRGFFERSFSLSNNPLARPGYVRAPSSMAYELIFIGRSGEAFPAGVEIYALPDALEPLDEQAIATDLWAILRWVIDGVGGEWTTADLEATGKLYQLPFLR